MVKKARPKNPAVEHAKAVIARSKSVGRGSDQFMLRLPDGMRDTIAEMAERSGRSMNAEIVNALVHQILRFNPQKEVTAGLSELINEAMAERIRRGEIQHSVREIGARLEHIATELDRIVSESREAVEGKRSSPPE